MSKTQIQSPVRQPSTTLSQQSPGSSVIDREVKIYVEKRAEYEKLKSQMEDAKGEYEEQKDRLWDVLDSNGLKTVNHDLGRITRGMNVRGYVKDSEVLEQELERAGLLSGARTLTWKQKLLNQLAKDGIEGDPPQGLFIDNQKRLTFTPRRAAAESMEPDTTD